MSRNHTVSSRIEKAAALGIITDVAMGAKSSRAIAAANQRPPKTRRSRPIQFAAVPVTQLYKDAALAQDHAQARDTSAVRWTQVIGSPTIGKGLIRFRCAANGRHYFTTSETVMMTYATPANGAPSKRDMEWVLYDPRIDRTLWE